ncbi:hypothetical protein F0U60_38045 [Archangium minus]|uniref:Uncharacterized protein n=1 Tax=Archangium minus TaxID=83450 RepID=A0ABY9X1K2_9BACT|nr:hypothetical protein F0U61_37690 [Archangium violaceum]WNG49282.1 hypothetical protein F0U60_38045 [Archangium minus]
MIRRRALIFLLALGTVTGYASGFASLYRWRHHGPGHACRHGHFRDSHVNDNAAPWAHPATQAQAPTPEPR